MVMVASRVLGVLFLLVALSGAGYGFKQELWLYLENGSALYFDTSVHNLSLFKSLLPLVTKYCTKGVWVTFKNANHQSFSEILGDAKSQYRYCKNINGLSILSVRHFADQDTSANAIYLYSEKNYASTQEFVYARAKAGTYYTAKSLSITGTSGYTLFDKPNLEGNSRCIKVPSGWTLFYDNLTDTPELNVRSIFKGCDAEEIEAFKKEYLS